MKKTYISPAVVTVQLNSCQAFLTTSDVVLNNDSANALGSGEILTKENVPSNSSIWDEEW